LDAKENPAVRSFSWLVLSVIAFGAMPATSRAADPDWTVMIYGCGDSSVEDHLMPHLRSLGFLSRKGQNGNVVLLFDRAPGFSNDNELLRENFEDTRLFELNGGKWNRVSGGEAFPEITLDSTFEANTGDARTLRKFIRFGKSAYPAKHYAIILFGHGHNRSFCPDATSLTDHGQEDEIYTAELSEALGPDESVDFAWFDVCDFGGIENAYQFRPGNGRFQIAAMIATPPSSAPAPMREILRRAAIVGEPPADAQSPADGVAFGTLAVSLTEKSLRGRLEMEPQLSRESWGCYDLSAAENAKQAVDRLAMLLAERNAKDAVEAVRGSGETAVTMHYFNAARPQEWAKSPQFDLYDLARRIHESAAFSEDVRAAAKNTMDAVDRLIPGSFGLGEYPGFVGGRNGIFILFPDGAATLQDRRHWEAFSWYHPADRRQERAAFGNLAWCQDGAAPGNAKVENWFELLDAWYDTDDGVGGVNGYRP
jgi:clostripain